MPAPLCAEPSARLSAPSVSTPVPAPPPLFVRRLPLHFPLQEFEVVFVSSDKDMGQFQEYFATMPWLAIPPGDKRKEALSQRYEVEGLPTLVIIDGATGETINAKGRGAVSGDPEASDFPWRPKALNNMDAGADGLNEEARHPSDTPPTPLHSTPLTPCTALTPSPPPSPPTPPPRTLHPSPPPPGVRVRDDGGRTGRGAGLARRCGECRRRGGESGGQRGALLRGDSGGSGC